VIWNSEYVNRHATNGVFGYINRMWMARAALTTLHIRRPVWECFEKKIFFFYLSQIVEEWSDRYDPTASLGTRRRCNQHGHGLVMRWTERNRRHIGTITGVYKSVTGWSIKTPVLFLPLPSLYTHSLPVHDNCYAYNAILNTWTPMPSLATARYGHAMSVYKGGCYQFGADDDN
jgi:hypothetical protein